MSRPFDLEKAKAGAPLVTRDGRAAKFIAHVPEVEGVLILVGKGVYQAKEDGCLFGYSSNDLDLFLADPPKVKKEWWVGIWRSKSGIRDVHVSSGKTEGDMLQEVNNLEYWELVTSSCLTWEEEAP